MPSRLLAAGALVQVIGELLQSSGSFLLGFDLAADEAQGQYQGVWNTSMSISTMVAPTVLALLPLGLGVPGWIILGVWFALIGVAVRTGGALGGEPAVLRHPWRRSPSSWWARV